MFRRIHNVMSSGEEPQTALVLYQDLDRIICRHNNKRLIHEGIQNKLLCRTKELRRTLKYIQLGDDGLSADGKSHWTKFWTLFIQPATVRLPGNGSVNTLPQQEYTPKLKTCWTRRFICHTRILLLSDHCGLVDMGRPL
jgi:hypothetical protein